jgi:CheY-like chemotaxis protein
VKLPTSRSTRTRWIETGAVDGCGSSQKALGPYTLNITDMTMPGMTGDRLTTEILPIRPEMLVIMCTGYIERISAKESEC